MATIVDSVDEALQVSYRLHAGDQKLHGDIGKRVVTPKYVWVGRNSCGPPKIIVDIFGSGTHFVCKIKIRAYRF